MGLWNGRLLVWNGNGMEKIASIEYGKIVFHSIPYHAMQVRSNKHVITRLGYMIETKLYVTA